MEGVGARFGRSSSRYGGPTIVFSGPVRKWKKKWVHVAPPNQTAAIGNVNGSNGGAHLQLFKWAPVALSQSKDGSDKDADHKNSRKDEGFAVEERPRKRFKYIPIVTLEDQKNESSDDEIKANDADMNENKDSPNKIEQRQDLNESTLDLSLGLKGHDGGNESHSREDGNKDN